MEVSEYVPVPGGRLWTTHQGRGPALVLCHGGPGLWDYLAPVAGMIDDLVSVYRYDQRALPGGDHLPWLEQPDQFKQALRAFLTRL